MLGMQKAALEEVHLHLCIYQTLLSNATYRFAFCCFMHSLLTNVTCYCYLKELFLSDLTLKNKFCGYKLIYIGWFGIVK